MSETVMPAGPVPSNGWPDTDAERVIPVVPAGPMKLADEFELRRLLAEERATTRQLSRALAEAVNGATFMGEPVLSAKPITVEAVAEVATNEDGPYLDWFPEGGISAMEPGDVLVLAHSPITDYEGRGEVFLAPVVAPVAPARHVGESKFEDWLSCHTISDVRGAKLALYHKQDLRDAYAAGMSDPTAAPVAPADGWEHLKVYGYAPGDYMSRCHKCGLTPAGLDKRATTCRPCAEAMHAAAPAELPTTRSQRMRDAGFTRRPTWHSLPGDDEPPPVAPVGMAYVPLVMTQAMRDVTDSEGWTWEDLLAAAEAITESQYEKLAAAAAPVAPAEPASANDAFNLVWSIAQSAVDSALAGAPARQHKETKRQCRAKFMAMMAAPVASAGDKPEREDMLRDMRDPGWRQRKEEIDRASARARFNQVFSAGDEPAPAAQPRNGMEPHGLDTATKVFFYEQDFYVLSNFSAFNLERDGLTFPTAEHAYHYEKFATDEMGPRSDVGYEIMVAPSAHEAFKIAERNRHLRRPDWDDVKVGIMLDILRAKAAQHEYVRRKLLATGGRELIENSWRDSYWGWGPERTGLNMLGQLWMKVREELRDVQPSNG